MNDIPVAIADTNALYRLFTPKDPRHAAHRDALDYLLTTRVGARASMNALDFIAHQVETRRFEVPEAAPYLRGAMCGYEDADNRPGGGIGDRDR